MKIIFAGDFAPCRRFEPLVLGGRDPIETLGDLLQQSDLSFVNLECPLTYTDNPLRKSGPSLKASPDCVESLRRFTVAGLANNHILDFEQCGIEDTLAALEAVGVESVGAGTNLSEAQAIYYKEVKGVTIAIVAVAEKEFNQATKDSAGCAPLDPIDNYKQIQEAKRHADVVIVTIHGGNEYLDIPRPGLRKLCRFMIDVGASAVICHHPHVPGGYEIYNDKLIAYSIGNFLFDRENAPEGWDKGYLVELQVDEVIREISGFSFHPYKQSVQLGGVQLLDRQAKAEFLERLDQLRACIENEPEYQKKWSAFVEVQAKGLIVKNYMPFAFRGIGFLSRNTNLLRLFASGTNGLVKLNLVRCESHQELLQEALKLELCTKNTVSP